MTIEAIRTTTWPAPEGWRPVVAGSLRDRARQRALDILNTLAAEDRAYDLGPAAALELGDGDAGLALAFAHAAELDPALADAEDEALGRVAAGVASVPLPPWLLDGTCGLAWAWHHLEAAGPEVLAQIDHAVAQMLAVPRWDAPLGLLDGLCGVVTYLLERRGSPVVDEALAAALGHLEARAELGLDGACWRRRVDELDPHTRASFPRGYVDLGMLRGTAGVLATLCRLHEAGVEPSRSAPLVERGVQWLCCRIEDDRLPAWEGDDERGEPGHGWCSGGLGLGTALLAASAVLDDHGLERRAVSLILADDSPRSGTDLGLCHGRAGLAHLLARAYQRTEDPRVARRAHVGLERLVEESGDPSRLPRKRGLLVGRAGVALALLAAADDRDPTWDRVLLASGLSRPHRPSLLATS